MTWTPSHREAALAHVQKVGQWIQEERLEFDARQVESKSLNSLVSYVDRQAEEDLVSGFQSILPGSGVIGEEGDYPWVDQGYNWVIDPLDGTTNFIHNLPPYAVSVALMDSEGLLWAAVFELGQNMLFWAEREQGAWLNGHRLQISNGPEIRQGLVATGFPYHDFEAMEAYLQVLRACFQGSRGVRRFGSAATDLAWVAQGRFAAFFEHGLAPWDVAAGVLLVREAGGRVSDFSGQAQTDFELIHARQIVAGNPHAQSTLVSWTQCHFSS